MKKIDLLSYSLLLSGIVLGAAAFWDLRYSQNGQLLVIFALVLFYLAWGLVYHFTKGDLSKKLFLEYILIALICCGVGILVFYL